MLLNIGDTQYATATKPVQIGPSFTLSLYMLFVGHAPTDTEEGPETPKYSCTADTPSGRPMHDPKPEEPYGFDEGSRRPIWQEVMHKARVRLCRTPLDFDFDPASGYGSRREGVSGLPASNKEQPTTTLSSDEFAYHLEIVEDLDDGRVHDGDGEPGHSYDSIATAGIRESIPIYHFSKIFYTDTGRILNIGNANDGDNNPVLLLKRDQNTRRPTQIAELLESHAPYLPAKPLLENDCASEPSDDQTELDRQLREESGNARNPGVEEDCGGSKYSWTLPAHLDPEWLAVEVFEEDHSDSDDSEDEMASAPHPRLGRGASLDSSVIDQIRNLSKVSSPLGRTSTSPSASRNSLQEVSPESKPPNQGSLVARSPFGAITTSLSLLEMLIRLTSLQEFQQMSHLAVPDHILTFFLEETSTTGLTGMARWKAHNETKQRVGFDPYTDIP